MHVIICYIDGFYVVNLYLKLRKRNINKIHSINMEYSYTKERIFASNIKNNYLPLPGHLHNKFLT